MGVFKTSHMMAKQAMYIAALLFVVHSATAQDCRIDGGTQYTHLETTAATAGTDAGCTACGSGTVVTSITAAASTITTAAQMAALVNNICPTIVFRYPDAGVASPSISSAAATGYFVNGQNEAEGGYGGTAQAFFQAGDFANAAPAANTRALVPCSTPVTTTACPLCGCNDLGIPTQAPTAATGAPTAAPTGVPTSDPFSITVSGNDNDLSGGAIAGIVIGSVVGAALVIGAGVMIGSK